jgi:hypothetical protein
VSGGVSVVVGFGVLLVALARLGGFSVLLFAGLLLFAGALAARGALVAVLLALGMAQDPC